MRKSYIIKCYKWFTDYNFIYGHDSNKCLPEYYTEYDRKLWRSEHNSTTLHAFNVIIISHAGFLVQTH